MHKSTEKKKTLRYWGAQCIFKTNSSWKNDTKFTVSTFFAIASAVCVSKKKHEQKKVKSSERQAKADGRYHRQKYCAEETCEKTPEKITEAFWEFQRLIFHSSASSYDSQNCDKDYIELAGNLDILGFTIINLRWEVGKDGSDPWRNSLLPAAEALGTRSDF